MAATEQVISTIPRDPVTHPRHAAILDTFVRRAVAVLVFAVLSGTQVASAQDAPPTIQATRLGTGDQIELDGMLDEAAWMRASPISEFRQQDPLNGEPATERTEVRIVYDEQRLIVGVICFDSEPGRVMGNQMQRDQSFGADDRFIFTIDTYLDGRSGYYFEVNPSGAMGDGLIAPGGTTTVGAISINRSWDGNWNARVGRRPDGWTAEIEVPFRIVNFDPSAATWGINFQRTVRRKNEEVLWAGYARNLGVTYMSAAGRLMGLSSLSQGLGLDVRPYVVGSSGAAPGRNQPDTASKGSFGGDIFYNLTAGLRANLSINTDFAETEVEQRQVNLTRFPLFFPEKRAFFLEGSSFFDFSREPGNAILPFFSRRIGLDQDGVPQPVLYGLKLTGQAGAFDMGALQVRTREHGGNPSEDFTVLRARRRFWRQSSIGALVTSRGAAGADARRTAGIDTALATSSFLGNQVLEATSFYLNTTKRPGSRGGAAFGGRINLPNDPWAFNASLQEVQDGYDPAVGFVERFGYRRATGSARWGIRPERHFIRRVSWQTDADVRYDLEGRLESRLFDVQLIRVILIPGDTVEFHLRPQYEYLPVDFEIFRGVVLPAGTDSSFLRRHFQLQSAPQRILALRLIYEDGPFYSGNRRQNSGTLDIRPGPGHLISLSADFNAISLAEGTFRTRLWRLDVNTQFSPFVSLVNRTQYDSVSAQLGWQSRFRWILKPGDDIFFVYAHNWVDTAGLTTIDRKASFKVVRTFSF